ncbi:MAG: protein kinase domain-containing protein, partial [Planctomycetota bacterium]
NIMVTPDGTAKLLDLGLARPTDLNAKCHTQTGMVVGSVRYMSPEQARGRRDLDARADSYPLGATLYHMVTGQVPFSGSTAVAILTKRLFHNRAPMR